VQKYGCGIDGDRWNYGGRWRLREEEELGCSLKCRRLEDNRNWMNRLLLRLVKQRLGLAEKSGGLEEGGQEGQKSMEGATWEALCVQAGEANTGTLKE
jgi:hypothetical protein